MRRCRWAVAVAAVAALAVGAAPEAPAARTQAGGVTARLLRQTPWVAPGGELVLQVAVSGARDPAAFEVFVGVHRAVRTRSAFARTLDGESLGALIQGSTVSLAELAPDAQGAVTLRVPVQAPGEARDAARVRLPGPGVFPVEVAVREVSGGEPLDRFVTHLVHVTGGGDVTPLRAALVVPVHAPPSLAPDLTRTFAAGPRLVPLARALAAAADVPVVVAPTPETLDAWAASTDEGDRAGLADLRRVAQRAQTLALPYVPVDVPSLGRAGLDGEVTRQRIEGVAAVRRVLGVEPDTATWVADGRVDEDAVQRLAREGVRAFLVPEARLVPVDLLVTLAQPFVVQGPGERRHPAVMADQGLAAHFRNGGDQVLHAHHLLADLAVLHLDQPGTARGVVVLPPPGWAPSDAFLGALLDGLATSPVVTASRLDDLLRAVEPATTSRGQPLTRRLEPVDPDPLGLSAEEVGIAVARASAFAGAVPAGHPLAALLPQAVLVAESTDLGSASARHGYLAGVDRRIDREIGQIDIPKGRSITLTARRGEIPVTFRNRAPYPVTVTVRLQSDKLQFPGRAERQVRLPPSRSHTERFTVETRTSGAFPLRVALLSPDGRLLLGQTRFTVRSTAASGVGIVLSVGAGLFLFAWWVLNFRGRRKPALVPA